MFRSSASEFINKKMIDNESGYAYIPKSEIQPIKIQEKADGPKKLFSEFSVIGDTSKMELSGKPINANTIFNEALNIFKIQKLQEGILFISKRSYVDDNEGNRIPRALLVTNEGKRLLKDNPGLLKKIDEKTGKERPPKTITEDSNVNNDAGYSGKVSILDLGDTESVAIKRFKRYLDGKRLRVGGLEVAKLEYALKQSGLADQVRTPIVYFATQDIIVMENIEDKKLAINEAKTHPEINEELTRLRKRIYSEIPEIIKELEIVGSLDGMLNRHLYIDDFDEETHEIKFVLIDPLC